MGDTGDQRVKARLLGAYRWLWQDVAAAHAARPPGGTVASVRVPDDPDRARALADLVGARTELVAGRTLPLRRIDRALARLDPTLDVETMVAAVGGPAPSRSGAAAEAAARRDELTVRLTAAVPGRWRDWASRHGRSALARFAGPDLDAQQDLSDRLVDLAAVLPLDPPEPLPLVAQRRAGGTKQLDPGSPLASLTLSMLAGGTLPRSASDRRDLWASVGVVADGLTTPVLTYQLPLDPATPAGAVVAAHPAHEPALLSPRLLAAEVVPAGPADVLWVCEGPALVEHVATLRLDVALLCFSGAPMRAHHDVVAAFAAAGWQVYVSADHEPVALRGAAALLETAGAAGVAWRLDVASHRDGREDVQRPVPDGDVVPDTPWDPALAAALRSDRRRVTEEGKVELLVADLQQAAGSPARTDSPRGGA
jgi:uncharacterized protein (TIGR02679 family)